MIKATDLIKKETIKRDLYYFKSKNGFELGNNRDFLKDACEVIARELYDEKYRESIKTANTTPVLEKIIDEREDKIAKLAARLEREFLNEEYFKPDLDENSALLTLYVDAKNDILSLENILETTVIPYYMAKDLEKDLYNWCRCEHLNKKSGFYKILACIDERDSDFGSTTVWYFEVRSYKPEVSNEQGVKIDDGRDDGVVAIVPSEYSLQELANNNYAICCFKPDDPFKVVGYVLADLQLAIKIARMLNEDLKRGGV